METRLRMTAAGEAGEFDPTPLLYVAGELPPDEQAAFDRAVAADPALAAAVAAIRGEQAFWTGLVAAADAADPIPAADEGAAVRQAGRAIRQWHARRATAAAARDRPAAADGVARAGSERAWWRQLPTWAYPAAVAAGLALAAIASWGVIPDSNPSGQIAMRSGDGGGKDDDSNPPVDAVATIDPPTIDADESARLERSFGGDDSPDLADAELQATGVRPGDDAAADTMFGDPAHD